MKIVQLICPSLDDDWKYKFAIFTDDDNGTELNYHGKVCSVPSMFSRGSIYEYYISTYGKLIKEL